MTSGERTRILLDSAKQVAPAIFFSLIIIVVSFLPVFLLEAQEGRMFRPLAWTKTLAVGFSSILAITLVPVLMTLFIRGKLRPESSNPISRVTQAIYLPVLKLCLRFPKTTLLVNIAFLACHSSRWPRNWAASLCRHCSKDRRSTCRLPCRESQSARRRS